MVERHNDVVPALPGWITRLERVTQAPASNVEEALLVDYPVELGLRRQEWRYGLLREYQLITYSVHDQHDVDFNVPRRLLALADEMTVRYGRLVEEHTAELERALAAGTDRIILRHPLHQAAVMMEIEFAKAMEESDAYCREQALMTLAPASDTYDLRRWVIEELVRQYYGHAARPWPEFLAELEAEKD